MEPEKPRIEIFAPFGAAVDRTKLILFQPFDLTKWLVIGFAAFLSNLGGGGGNGFNFNTGSGDTNWSLNSKTQEAVGFFESIPTWLVVLVVAVVVAIFVLVIVLMWVGARGKFIFTDCVVRNRGAIVEPWTEFRREGNSLFLFRIAVGLISLVLFGLASLPLWWPFLIQGITPSGALLVAGIGMVCLVVLLLICFAVGTAFMAPIMYRRRCGALQGARESLGLFMNAPGPVILFILFAIVIWMAIMIGMCVVTCITCCLAAIPYVGTVMLLPVYVFWMSYVLLFVRQFGPEYDAWANIAAATPEVPPVQEAATPTEPPALPSAQDEPPAT